MTAGATATAAAAATAATATTPPTAAATATATATAVAGVMVVVMVVVVVMAAATATATAVYGAPVDMSTITYPTEAWHVTLNCSYLGEPKIATGERGGHNEIVVFDGEKHGKRKSEVFFTRKTALEKLLENEQRRKRWAENNITRLQGELDKI